MGNWSRHVGPVWHFLLDTDTNEQNQTQPIPIVGIEIPVEDQTPLVLALVEMIGRQQREIDQHEYDENLPQVGNQIRGTLVRSAQRSVSDSATLRVDAKGGGVENRPSRPGLRLTSCRRLPGVRHAQFNSSRSHPRNLRAEGLLSSYPPHLRLPGGFRCGPVQVKIGRPATGELIQPNGVNDATGKIYSRERRAHPRGMECVCGRPRARDDDDKAALRDDAEAILLAAARDMQVEQSLAQQERKSKGHGGEDTTESDRLDDASARHADERVGSGFDINEVVSEYRALRASVLRLWRKSLPQPDLDDITRFNESIDQSLAKAVGSYTERVDRSRQMFLAILGHDLRNPLNCIHMAAQFVLQTNGDPKSAETLSMIGKEVEAMAQLISDLIEFSSTWLGSAMPLNRDHRSLQARFKSVQQLEVVFVGVRGRHEWSHSGLAKRRQLPPQIMLSTSAVTPDARAGDPE